MSRPPSIILFERLYLGSLALFLMGTAAFWSRTEALTRERLMAMPNIQANPAFASIMVVTLFAMVVIITLVTILFWWLVARRRSAVGKWLVVATELFGVLSALSTAVTLARGTNPNPPAGVVNLVASLMAIAAAVVLFRPDADAWLTGTGAPGSGF